MFRSTATIRSQLLVVAVCFTLCGAFTSALTTTSTSDQLSEPSSSSYGERLAESSAAAYSFFNSVSSANGGQKLESSSSSLSDGGDYSPGVSALLNSDGFLNTMSKFSGGGGGGGLQSSRYTPSGPVEAAVHTKKTIEVIPVRFEEAKEEGDPQVIEISPYEVPLSIVFKTATNKINVNQEHRSETPEEVKETTSEEEPHRVVHNVYRPVIQEVTEVIQPIRKMLQRVEPVIEEMKTIISKAGPPEAGGGGGNQHSNGYSRPSRPMEENRFARYGGNDLGRGLSIVPLSSSSSSYSSASEVIKKLSSPPPTGENEISRRFGVTNRPTRVEESGGNSNSYSSQQQQQQQSAANEEDASANGGKGDYNELIKEYITRFLHEPKPGATKKRGANPSKSTTTNTNKPHLSKHPINPQSIKMFSNIVPLPSNTIDSIKPYRGKAKSGSSSDQHDHPKPKFKIIKEFRVTLDDLKRLQLAAPFVSLQANNKGGRLGSSSPPTKNSFNSRPHFSSSNFSVPLSASSFRPLVMTGGGGGGGGMTVAESQPVKIIAQLLRSPQRIIH